MIWRCFILNKLIPSYCLKFNPIKTVWGQEISHFTSDSDTAVKMSLSQHCFDIILLIAKVFDGFDGWKFDLEHFQL